MAVQLSKGLSSGGTAEYWRISPSMTVDVLTPSVAAAVEVYINSAARLALKRPVMHHDIDRTGSSPDSEAPHHISLTGADATAAIVSGDPRAALYTALKALPYFDGCTDC